MDNIEVRGARTHNLKNINLIIPRDKLIVITGLSGSGKSSLAFDTLYAEGQRRYVESLSAYARQFLSLMEKPDVDHIEGLSPAISIEQKSTSHNPRSTVGTITEIHDYLRLLFARVGEPRCPDHDIPLAAQTISQMVDNVLVLPEGQRLMLLAPVVKERKGEHTKLLDNLAAQGYIRARIDGEVCDLSDPPKLELQKKHTIEVVVDRFKVRADLAQRLAESFETALELSGGTAVIANMDDEQAEELIFSANFACSICGYSMSELEPRLFSFNNPAGACPTCDGLGVQQFFDPERVIQNGDISLAGGAIRGWDRRNFYYFQMLKSLSDHYKFDIEVPFNDLDPAIRKTVLYGSDKESIEFKYTNDRGDTTVRHHPFEGVLHNMERRYKETESTAVREELAKYISNRSCISCDGTRLRKEARYVFIESTTLPQISEFSIGHAMAFFQNIKLSGQRAQIAEKILKEIRDRLKFLVNVGLNYLTLSRSAETLSGGEAQRIRLASQIGAGLVGVMYVLDEPSIGLHQRDNERLLETLLHLRNLGNTVIVVEHDEDAIRAADHVIDIGPGAGVHGGRIVAEGTIEDIMTNKESLTGKFLSGKCKIAIPEQRVPANPDKILELIGAKGNNLKKVTLKLPVGLFTCVTGVSGSGKSTLINDTLFPIAQRQLNGATNINPAPYLDVQGLEHFDKVIDIDQSPIGRTPRSNPATYTGVFTPVRELFSGVPESRARGYTPGRFSFNVKGGRCEACQGDGVIKVEMHFLPDVYVPCDHCKSKRYNRETLEIKYKGKNINEVLNMTIEEAREFFDAVPALARKLQTLMDVGLSYIRLGQSATTLSGGEAQRVKLSRELSKRGTGQTLYILDEPTTGLHFADIQQLLSVLHQLRDQGNTIVVIEHNLDVIKTADWIVDLGPEGGNGGGEILVSGTPEEVAQCEESHTARFLKPILERQ
ncbi:excinuclease ABC subunit UvrA [Xenorhabdus bovienii]|uniref:UvrABC system protein A n=3 Tax=Xenorhabdus bovienii TaxID=40576 RepID=A0A0B6XE70_XENBV|nr:excinuclease ABC subunit UvrA [Xenorhabdus bovienii]CDG90532.1 DNA excision repair enzyme subunit, with UvrBC [Xenorhabdus bovienii str. feltiae France]CDG93586.1 DNA excision repair enzyme subunit, with UvrBC [Xenorhabdus bovienii str. feltiae Florida]CDH04020.1 DNA excision repair enzyme subunit, with UvrBC [Xenorhabdus bovienii str. feltiae Moldova]CDH26252.1 DNA excision repair enzyme subunit, with UvrBC [Xenorhabdus bovienii str. kraussei Becker Underwood]CDM91456.1 UvrABC system prote